MPIKRLGCLEVSRVYYLALDLILFLVEEKPSNEYSPDEFSSEKDPNLKFGRLEPEVYIELKYED